MQNQSMNESQLSALDLRAKLHELVQADLLGPVNGPEEEVSEANVRGRYIVGLLAPRGQTTIPEETESLAADGGGEADLHDGAPDDGATQTASLLPSSIGLTFTVAKIAGSKQPGEQPVTELLVKATWGHYKREHAAEPDADGKDQLIWKRYPVEAEGTITLKAGSITPWQPNRDEQPDVVVSGRCREYDDSWIVTLFLVNGQTEAKQDKDAAWLFQPQLTVRDADHRPIFIQRPLPADLQIKNDEDKRMAMLYRRTVEFGVGHGVAVHAKTPAPLWDRATQLRTDVMPSYEVERMDPPTAADIPQLQEAVFDMKVLCETEQGNFGALLQPLTDAYTAWIDEQESALDSPPPDLAGYAAEAGVNMEACRSALARIRSGILLIDTNDQAAKAFQFANRAMWQQRIHSIYAGQKRQGNDPQMEQIDVARSRSWRPFQLAFVLLNIAGLNDPTDDERGQLADLLWFPTGGGKTEAYLGVAAFALAVRRLQGELGGLSGHAGVAVLMRYTLRLLTLQQFQRATALIMACESIRQQDPATWGPEPFRIGLWVGQASTPNWTKQSYEAVKAGKGNSGYFGGASGNGTPYQLTYCPWCGSDIEMGKHFNVETYEAGRARTFQYCGDKMGRCSFSWKQSPDEGLPIVVVDEEIYRRLPSLLIATVDKFAQMPWKGETQMLFGRVNGHCSRHGFVSSEVEDSSSHPKKGKHPAAKTVDMGPLRPPDLIIQDELHLISGPLGTLVGLYETAVDKLCSWELNGQTVRPKVIASTATIRRANEQVHALFDRKVEVFPPSGLDARDNFFARQRESSEAAPGRLYVGVCAPGIRFRAALIRVYIAYMAAAQTLYEEHGELADPWMTLVGYFNAMRELGGMRRAVDDSVSQRLRSMAQRGLANRYVNPLDVQELTSRRGAAEIPKLLDRLDVGFTAQNGFAGQPVELPAEGKAHAKPTGDKPLDVVLATNMISVGVDVSRLGLMITAGQPKATAEYIQATSRVGRQFPGLVCTVYNWTRPRDLSHYERFEHYHATFYQQVEALSVTPFAARALSRGLMGVLVSLIRLAGDEYNENLAAGQVDRQHTYLEDALDTLRTRAETVFGSQAKGDAVEEQIKVLFDNWLHRISQQSGGAKLGYQGRKDGKTLGLLYQPEQKDWDDFTCLNSLRDVEPQVGLVLDDYGMERVESNQ